MSAGGMEAPTPAVIGVRGDFALLSPVVSLTEFPLHLTSLSRNYVNLLTEFGGNTILSKV